MLKAIHAQGNKTTAEEKIRAVISKLENIQLKRAADKVRNGAHEPLSYYFFPSQH